MKLSSHLLAAWATATATALSPVPKVCGDGVLYPNSTIDIPAMVNCTHRTTYQCLDELNAPKDEYLTSNASDNATISAKCSEAFYEFQVGESGDFDGSLVVPDLVKLKSVYIAGDYYPNLYSDGEWRPNDEAPTYFGINTINFPDLVNITGQIDVHNANNVSSLTMPKLEFVDAVHIDFSGGPAINLTFPSLSSIGAGLFVKGDINSLEFPALTQAPHITVESTGDLDCEAFATKVVDVTVRFRSSDQWKDAVVCSSNKGSTKKSLPSAGNDSASGPSFRANMLLVAIFVSCASLLV